MTDAAASPETLARSLVDLLDVEELDRDLYRGARKPGGVGRVFGGQVIAQGLQAAQRSTDAAKSAHSLHAYFMRPGDEHFPIIYRVVRDFEGRSFATRRVIAMQRGEPILNMACSFQLPEDGRHHQDAMPDVPPPEGLRTDLELRREIADRVPARFRELMLRDWPIELRPVSPRDRIDPSPADQPYCNWLKVAAPIGDDPAMHRAVLAFASDMTLLGACQERQGISWVHDKMQTASLDHALWFHEPFRADEWLLYVTDSPWAGHARGFNRGSFFTRDGRLVASAAQEGLIRLRG